MRGLVIAGTHSGVGKTTVATGIMAVLKKHGYSVKPFKVGPDYIDPSYHTRVCGVPCRNLDPWMVEPSVTVALFQRAVGANDIAIVEGVMGLYDGAYGESEEGSTAHLAKLLGLPVVLVVDASAGTRSVGACVLGFKSFDPELKLDGVILNGIAGEKHLELVKPSLARAGVRLLGYLPSDKSMALPERHLGLIPTAEGALSQDFFQALVHQMEKTLDIEGLLALAGEATLPRLAAAPIFPDEPQPLKALIAVAQDQAFSFYYPDALDLLKSWGAELVSFSPLRDEKLPQQTGGIYIGGGFPELYAQGLSENRSMLEAMRQKAAEGIPLYAECGGLMYLCKNIEDQQGKVWPMAGVVPADCSLKDTRLTLGYRTVRVLRNNLLMKAGDRARGHEFHLSALKGYSQSPSPVYEVLDQKGRREGFQIGNVLASYIHIHFASRQGLAPRLVEQCSGLKQS